MTETRKQEWRAFARGLAFATCMASIAGISFVGVKGPLAIPVSGLAFGLPFGVLCSFAGSYLDNIRVRSFLATTLLRTVFWVAVLLVAFVISFTIEVAFLMSVPPFSPKAIGFELNFYRSTMFWLVVAGTWMVSMVISSILAVSKKLGPGVMVNWLRGYYHVPREEDRIFMFLDLRDSTALAERLGNLKFSALVRDFFSDLSGPVIETRGQVSHYIGDEAVLTWTMARGIDRANCLRCFFLMRRAIEKKQEHYLKTYGLLPGFKAGVHCGWVVTTEVGDIKSEIVYHGDVMNTAARIQGLCDSLGAPLLISAGLAARLGEQAGFCLTAMGQHALKGKELPVGVVAVSELDLRPIG